MASPGKGREKEAGGWLDESVYNKKLEIYLCWSNVAERISKVGAAT